MFDQIKKAFNNANKLDAVLLISGAVISLGIVIAVIVFAFKEWRWLVGIGVPCVVDAVIFFLIYLKIKKLAAGKPDVLPGDSNKNPTA